jgi:hypothetical protein
MRIIFGSVEITEDLLPCLRVWTEMRTIEPRGQFRIRYCSTGGIACIGWALPFWSWLPEWHQSLPRIWYSKEPP